MKSRDCVVLRCSCGNGMCHKMLQVQSVRKAISTNGVDPVRCPVHEDQQPESIKEVFHALEEIEFTGICIWELHCVPGHGRMSVDVALMQKSGRVYLVEADGSSHFQHGLETRPERDAIKDDALKYKAMPMLRLHYMDKAKWHEYLQMFLQTDCLGVKYSSCYSVCLEQENQYCVIHL